MITVMFAVFCIVTPDGTVPVLAVPDMGTCIVLQSQALTEAVCVEMEDA